MIQGRHDTYYTVQEFAEMVGRSPKTVRNWASSGRIVFVHLCGTPLVSLSTIENLITGHVPLGAEDGKLALQMMKRSTSQGHRQQPEKRGKSAPMREAAR